MWKSLLELLVMPPTSLIALALAGGALHKRRPKVARRMWLASAALAMLLALPYVGGWLLFGLQRVEALPAGEPIPPAQAIVVISAEHNPAGPEYGGPTVGPMTLERLRYAANLALRTDLPIACSGGIPRRGHPPMAKLMREALEGEFGVEVKWLEERSANTRENARYTAELLRPLGIERILLVTHAWHQPRAAAQFRAAGFEVIPAPTGFRVRPALEVSSFVPGARAFRESCWALHEWVGRAWYGLSG
jgi:uncharacterized SAM-binding protein YcdF (DUF218 family)